MNTDVHSNTLATRSLGNLSINSSYIDAAPTMVPYEEEMEISGYLDILLDNLWLILGITLVVTGLGAAYAFVQKPVFEATMLIQVEEDKPNTSKNMLGDISTLFDVKTEATSEMELLNSRLVIGRVVDDLGLYVNVRPKQFPVIGRWVSANSQAPSDPGIFGYGGYLWGNEKINIANFNAADGLQDKDFVITAGADGSYQISQEELGVKQSGTVGVPTNVETGLGSMQLLVGQMSARPGGQFILKYRPKMAAIGDLQKSLTIAERGKQSGIIAVTLEGENPAATSNILSTIGKEYLQQNITRKLAEAEKSLAFVDDQLPDLKQKLDKSETDYFQFRNGHGTIDLPEEARLSLQQGAADKAKRLELQQKREELLVNFTENHPVVIGIDKQIRSVNEEIGAINEHIRQLPLMEENLLRLGREMKTNTDLYAALLGTAQQLRLVKAGKVSNVRLIDAPMTPDKPLRPNRPKIIGLAFLVGLILSLAVVVFRKMVRGGIDDPRKIEQMLGVKVIYACIPHSKIQRDLLKRVTAQSKILPLLAELSPADSAIESLRSFRTTFQNTAVRFKNNVVMITGPTAGVGKSFVSANFAAVMASSGKRVLLIDSDFRNGHLHRYFGLERKGGLSDLISGMRQPAQVIHRGVVENLDFLSTGSLPPNPSEFLLHKNFGDLLKLLSTGYDYILVDPPPILAVSDSLVIGAHAGAVFILTRSDITTDSEINESIKRLNHAGISPTGILFNDLKVRSRQYEIYNYETGEDLLHLS